MRRIIVTAALGLALSAGGCAATTGGDSPGAAGAPGAGETTTTRDSLAVTTLTGETFDAAATDGEPVILWFWAPWCTICRAEAPDVAEVAAELEAAGSSVTVLGVPGRGGVPEMEDFVADTGTGDLTHLVDEAGTIWREYGVITQPAFALLGADGQVEVINGALGADGLRDAAERLAEG